MAKYEFLNLNPLGDLEEDCVCRAISLALEEDYYTIEEKLQLVGDLFDCTAICVCCYKFLLDEVYGLERIEEVQGMTIEEFAHYFPKGTYLIRINGHLTCLIDGTIYDLWYCNDKIVDLVWKVN